MYLHLRTSRGQHGRRSEVGEPRRVRSSIYTLTRSEPTKVGGRKLYGVNCGSPRLYSTGTTRDTLTSRGFFYIQPQNSVIHNRTEYDVVIYWLYIIQEYQYTNYKRLRWMILNIHWGLTNEFCENTSKHLCTSHRCSNSVGYTYKGRLQISICRTPYRPHRGRTSFWQYNCLQLRTYGSTKASYLL